MYKFSKYIVQSKIYVSKCGCWFLFIWQYYIDLCDKINEGLSCLKADFIPTIGRGREILRYHDTSDGRMKEYDFDK